MKLAELKGVKKYHHLSRWDIDQLLSKEGIDIIGNGKYGQVYSHKSWDYVIKVTKNDPYYMSFIDHVIKHPNKHYPKIIKKPLNLRAFYSRLRKDTHEKLFIVKIEKLEPIPKELGKFISEHLDTFIMIDHHLKNLDNDEESKFYLDNDYKDYKNIKTLMPDGTRGKYISNREMAKKYPWMIELSRAWYAAIDHTVGESDNHPSNFMQRKDGTIVIIDPVWEGWNPMKEHDRIMAAELDDYEDYDDTVSGPAFKVKEKEYPVIQSIVNQFNDDDDIPF